MRINPRVKHKNTLKYVFYRTKKLFLPKNQWDPDQKLRNVEFGRITKIFKPRVRPRNFRKLLF